MYRSLHQTIPADLFSMTPVRQQDRLQKATSFGLWHLNCSASNGERTGLDSREREVMKDQQRSRAEFESEVDRRIVHHLTENCEGKEDGLPYAPISSSDRLSWANRTGVDFNFIEERLAALCEKLAAKDEHLAVPRFRLKSKS